MRGKDKHKCLYVLTKGTKYCEVISLGISLVIRTDSWTLGHLGTSNYAFLIAERPKPERISGGTKGEKNSSSF